jgi:hypothetical protein
VAEHLSEAARAVLAQSGLDLRAREILGNSADAASYDEYRDALIQAYEEGAGTAYIEKIAGLANVKALEHVDESEAEHRSAVSYLRAMGKHDYSDDDYIEAVTLVRSVKA